MTLTPQFLDELRSRTLLSALVGKSVKLQKAGREFRGCCPFHNEKTPSFYVNDDKAFYHCFGCSAHGDAIRWMTDQRGLPFMDAVKELAQSAGMDMPAMDARAAEKAEAAKGLHEAMDAAAHWFTDQLMGIKGGEARAVLERRGIKAETAKAFGLGFSPDSRGKLRAKFKDFGDPLLIEAGLLIKVDDKEPYDRFRGRLMIPIRDPRGRVIAFGGRVIGDGEPKYLNSPDTPLFDKGRTLYNLDRAAAASRKSGRVIVVEGYMDVIALAQAGFGEAVAPLGTALTEAQLERLWRLSEVPILCFDGDNAGQKAAIRAAHRALPMLAPGRSLAFATLPPGQDPDDVIASSGPTAFEKILKNAVLIEEQIWRSEIAALPNPGPHERAALKDRLHRFAESIENLDVRREYRKSFDALFYSVFGWKKDGIEAVRQAIAEATRKPTRGVTYAFQRAILLGLMRHPKVIMQVCDGLHRVPFVDRYLVRWASLLLDLAFDHPNLDESLVDQILAQSDVSPIEQRDLTRDLAFSFYSKSADPEVACRDLKKVIETMIEEHEAAQAFALAKKAMADTMTESAFDLQTRCQREFMDAQARLREWREMLSEAA